MIKRTRNILIIVAVVLLIFTGLIGLGAYSLYSFFSRISSSREIPAEIKDARILKGADFLSRREFYKINRESLLDTIGKSAQVKDEKERQKIVNSQTAKGIYGFNDLQIFGDEIIAAARFGAYVFDFDGNLKRQILFEPSAEKIKVGSYERETYQSNLDNLKIVRFDRDKFGFLSYGSSAGVRIFNADGDQIWNYGKEDLDLSVIWSDEKEREERYEKSQSVSAATVGDLDNDGISEYIVARRNDGIRAFDGSGNEKWFAPDKSPGNKLEVLDSDNDGKNELLEIGYETKVFDADGKNLREIRGASSDAAILFSENKNKKKILIFCGISDRKFVCKDENDNQISENDLPMSEVPRNKTEKVDVPGHPELSFENKTENIYSPKAFFVNLEKNRPKFLAVIGSFSGIPRAIFYLYDNKGNLVYQELLPENAETIAVIPAANGSEDIIIGGKDTIWRYAAR
ncbi:MAG: hypothetical protein ACR2L1_07125 [Pyrinomonadaceae bacterium]